MTQSFIKQVLRGLLWLNATLFLLPVYADSALQLIVNKGRYSHYYHVRYELNAKNIDFDKSDHEISSGGQFTIRLKPEYFEIPAPNCQGLLILRMPWTSSGSSNAEQKISIKTILFNKLLALHGNQNDILSVVLELNPYVRIRKRNPIKAELTQCNLYFRHAYGGYVDHTSPLSTKK